MITPSEPKSIILFGSGQMGRMAARLLSSDYRILAFADNFEGKWGSRISGIPVISPREALTCDPDLVCLCVLDAERQNQMKEQLSSLGFQGEYLDLGCQRIFDARCAIMRMLAEQIYEYGIPGDVAELGVFRGEFSALIQQAFPDRRLHLFDTFEGFFEEDVVIEKTQAHSRAKTGDFSETSIELVLGKLPDPDRAMLYPGWFPETFDSSETAKAATYAFVSLDADLYAPTRAALPLFYERLAPGGVLLIHDVYSTQFTGCKAAVDEFCKEKGILPYPVSDLHGSAVVRKPLRG